MRKKIILLCGEVILGFISVWWFIIALAMAINPDHDKDATFLIPVGYIFLVILFVSAVYGNYFLYKKHYNKSFFIIYQLVPFFVGLMIAILQTV